MKILITGGSSLLGRALQETAPKKYDTHSTWYTNQQVMVPMYQMDILNHGHVATVFDRVKPDIVIHCAANGSVDYAEQNYQEVHDVIVGGTDNILKAANDYRAKVVYISTNAVFSGNHSPYSEKSATNPINAYGSIKRQAERRVMDSRSWLIVRPYLLYGWPWPGGRQNWATIIIDKLTKGEPLKLVNDITWMPTYAPDCAAAIWRLLETENQVYNVAAREMTTLYNFGLAVAKIFELDAELLSPVSSDYFKTIAKRPRNTAYDLRKIHDLGITLRKIKPGLKAMKKAGFEDPLNGLLGI